jgi:hypothetical protein
MLGTDFRLGRGLGTDGRSGGHAVAVGRDGCPAWTGRRLTPAPPSHGGTGTRPATTATRRLTARQAAILREIQAAGGRLEKEAAVGFDGRAVLGLTKAGLVSLTGEGELVLSGKPEEGAAPSETVERSAAAFRSRAGRLFGERGWQRPFAEALGTSTSTLAKYLGGKLPVPAYAWLALDLLERLELTGGEPPQPLRFRSGERS